MKFNHKKLEQVRRSKKLSVYASARELSKNGLDISHQTIINWEKGLYIPNCDQLAKIANYYGKTFEYFFALKPSKASYARVNGHLKSNRSNVQGKTGQKQAILKQV